MVFALDQSYLLVSTRRFVTQPRAQPVRVPEGATYHPAQTLHVSSIFFFNRVDRVLCVAMVEPFSRSLMQANGFSICDARNCSELYGGLLTIHIGAVTFLKVSPSVWRCRIVEFDGFVRTYSTVYLRLRMFRSPTSSLRATFGRRKSIGGFQHMQKKAFLHREKIDAGGESSMGRGATGRALLGCKTRTCTFKATSDYLRRTLHKLKPSSAR